MYTHETLRRRFQNLFIIIIRNYLIILWFLFRAGGLFVSASRWFLSLFPFFTKWIILLIVFWKQNFLFYKLKLRVFYFAISLLSLLDCLPLSLSLFFLFFFWCFCSPFYVLVAFCTNLSRFPLRFRNLWISSTIPKKNFSSFAVEIHRRMCVSPLRFSL